MGIYLWDIFRTGTPKRKTDILNAVDETPDTPFSPFNTNETPAHNYSEEEALADLGSLLAQSRNQNINIDNAPEPLHVTQIDEDMDDDEVELPLDMSVKDYETSIGIAEEESESDIFAELEKEYEQEEAPVNNIADDEQDEYQEEVKEKEVPESNKSCDDLLVLYITSPSHISFNGLSISKAADEVGMIYGHMNIFHHFGPGKLHSGQPLFSLANMHEPGSFDLGRMAELKTKGLALFMYSPASIDPSVVFELFLNTTQRLSELLGGTVRTSDNKQLSNNIITELREKAERLSIVH
jgi:cell division protein ZipA